MKMKALWRRRQLAGWCIRTFDPDDVFLGCKRGISETGCGRNFADGVGEYAMARRRFSVSAVCYPISGFGLGRVARPLAILDDDGRVGACRL